MAVAKFFWTSRVHTYIIMFFYLSDELLLQEDSSVVSGLENEFSKGMHLSQALGPTETLIGGKRVGGTLNTSSNMMMQR